jgi:hypothetical protein
MSATARLGTARPRSPSAAAASNEWADGFAWAAEECVQFHGITHCGPGPAFRHCWACGRRASLPGPGRQDRPGKPGRLRPLLLQPAEGVCGVRRGVNEQCALTTLLRQWMQTEIRRQSMYKTEAVPRMHRPGPRQQASMVICLYKIQILHNLES